MKRIAFALLVTAAATPLTAEEHRELGAHEHGVGQLNIAFEGNRIAMELDAPGADIAGFEHHAESVEDRAAIDNAVAQLARPLNLFVLPEAAGCSVTEASAELVSEEQHEHEGHEEHAEGEGHDADEEMHADHDDHGAEHSEFNARYLLTCAEPSAVTRIDFAYFTTFPKARELEVQIVSDKGAQGFEVERDNPVLDLTGHI